MATRVQRVPTKGRFMEKMCCAFPAFAGGNSSASIGVYLRLEEVVRKPPPFAM
jgi:hypothetical protein